MDRLRKLPDECPVPLNKPLEDYHYLSVKKEHHLRGELLRLTLSALNNSVGLDIYKIRFYNA